MKNHNMNYYKVPKEKVSVVLDIMEKADWEWTDGKSISKWKHIAERNPGKEYSVFGIDHSIGKDTGNLYKRVSQNPDFLHETRNIKKPLKEYVELVKLLSPIFSENYEITSDEIRDNAKVICNFLELRIIDKRAKSNPKYHVPFSNIPTLDYCFRDENPEIEMEHDVNASETLFHCDWSWLMELVDAIERLKFTEEVIMHKNHSYVSHRDIDTIIHKGENRLEATYKACVEFIKKF